MKTDTPLNIYLRILLAGLFIALLGIGPSPHIVQVFLNQARQSLAIDDTLTASQSIAQAAEYFPWRSDLYILAGRYAFQAGDPEAAIQFLERPGAISHLTPDDLVMLGDAYQQSGDAYMAEAIWRRVTELEKSRPAYQRLADLYLQRKDFAEAANNLREILLLDPSDANLYYQIGLLYTVSDPEAALPFLSQAAEISPTLAPRAKTLYNKIRTAHLFDEPAYTSLTAGRELANLGEWELANEAFLHATQLRPDYAEAWAFLGEAIQHLATQSDADASYAGLPELQQALRLDPNSVLANTFMGLYWERQEDYSQAQQYLNNAIALDPQNPILYSELGNTLAKTGDLPSAQIAYETAIQLAPNDPLYYRILTEYALQHQIQLRELALPAARQAVILSPNDPRSLDLMAQTLLMLEDYHSAERFSLRTLQADPNYSPAFLHLGVIYLFLGDPQSAHQWLSLARATEPDSSTSEQASRLLAYYFP